MSTHTSPAEAEPRHRTPARGRWAVAGIVGALALAAMAVGIVAVDRDGGVPYSDPAVTGRLTLCGANGKALTEGDATRPLAAVVLGSSKLPPRFAVRGAVGSLFAFQPRPGVEASEFSGLQLSGSSGLADPTVQTGVRITKDATQLSQFVVAFPAQEKGFVQLRLYVSAPNAGTLTSQYDSADVRVIGDRWELVRGGGADCSKASAALIPQTTS